MTKKIDPAKDAACFRRLFTDNHFIEKLEGAFLQLNHPERREVAFVIDGPAASNCSAFLSIVAKPEGGWRMYYRGGCFWDTLGRKKSGEFGIFASDSADGLEWHRITEKSILMTDSFAEVPAHVSSASIFGDTNPACPADEYYKMLFIAERPKCDQLFMAVSGDGINFRLKNTEPFDMESDFDTQNVVFYDENIDQYRFYTRSRRHGIRGIKMHLTKDFKRFTNASDLFFINDPYPETQLYHNCIQPYFRAKGLYLGFPERYCDHGQIYDESLLSRPEIKRRAALVQKGGSFIRLATVSTDTLFMSSYDGWSFKRYHEAFVRPGASTSGNWIYGDNEFVYGMIPTVSPHGYGTPDELSFYTVENYWNSDPVRVRRFAIRQDGFVSVHFPADGGQVVTTPFELERKHMTLNLSTSAWGICKAGLLDEDGNPIPGFSQKECFELCGDSLSMPLRFKNKGIDLSELIGRKIRLALWGRDADLYSFTQEKNIKTEKLPKLDYYRKEPDI